MQSLNGNNSISVSWNQNAQDTKILAQDIDKPQSIFASLDSNNNLSIEKSEAQSEINTGFNKNLNETSIMNEVGNSYGKEVKTKAFNNSFPQTTLQSLYNKFSAKFQNIKYNALKSDANIQAPYNSLQNQINSDIENKLQNQISKFNNSAKTEYTQIIKDAMEAAKAEIAAEQNDSPKEDVKQQDKFETQQDGDYTIKKGDNLTKIAKAHGTTPQAIAELNGMSLNDIIYPGQSLKIPGQIDNSVKSTNLEEVVISGNKNKIKTPQLNLASLASTQQEVKIPKIEINKSNQSSNIVSDNQKSSSNNSIETDTNNPSTQNTTKASSRILIRTETKSPTYSSIETSIGERTVLQDNSSIVTHNSTMVKRGRLSGIKLSTHYAADNKTLISEQFINNAISGVQMVSQRNYENGSFANIETDLSQYDSNSSIGSLSKEFAIANTMQKGASKAKSSEIRNNDGEVILSFKDGQFLNSKGKPIEFDKAVSILEKADKKGKLKKLIQNMV